MRAKLTMRRQNKSQSRFYLYLFAIAASAAIAIMGCGDDGVSTKEKNAKQFTVNFNPQGGIPGFIDPVTVDSGTIFSTITPAEPTKAGYTFDGWFDGELEYTDLTVITKTVTLAAKWTEIIKYAVTYNGNGSDGGAVPVDPKSPYLKDSTVTVLDVGSLTKTGHTFSGWNTRADGNGASYVAGNMFAITGDITLYAKWVDAAVTTYAVTVSSEGIGASGSGSYKEGDTVTINAGTAQGKQFVNWTTASDGVTFANANNAATSFVMPANAVTVTANFQVIYTVTYVGNGGVGTAPVDTGSPYLSGSMVTVLDVGDLLERDGYTFNGWNTAPNGSGVSYVVGYSFAITANMTFYAMWTKIPDALGSALSAEPVATVSPSQVPQVLDYFTDGSRNWYVIDAGYIRNSLIMQIGTVRHIGIGETSISRSVNTTQAMSTSRTQTVSNSVAISQGGTETIGISYAVTETNSKEDEYKAGFDWVVQASVQRTIGSSVARTHQVGHEISRNFSIEQGRTTETSASVETSISRSLTHETRFTVNREDPAGYYRYAWYTVSDVFFIISTSLDNQTLRSWEVVSAARGISVEGLEYSPDGNFDNSPRGNLIVFADDFYKRLPQPKTGILIDRRDNQTYRTVEIGGKWWMAENLNFRPSTGNFWCYDNDTANCNIYGRLYDWNTAMNEVCPVGWRLPDSDEWTHLVKFAGGTGTYGELGEVAAKKLKSGPVDSPSWNGTNDYEFSALPGGSRNTDGGFALVGNEGNWWTATPTEASSDYWIRHRRMTSDSTNVTYNSNHRTRGFSVRCIKE